ARQSIDARSVLGQHGPAEPDDRAPEVPSRLRLEIEIDGRPCGNIAQLGLPEVRHHVPGATVDEREDLGPAPCEGARRNIEIDDSSAEGRAYAGVLEVELGRVQCSLRRGEARV